MLQGTIFLTGVEKENFSIWCKKNRIIMMMKDNTNYCGYILLFKGNKTKKLLEKAKELDAKVHNIQLA